MGRYWKRKFYKKNSELRRQKKQMKVILGIMIFIIGILSVLIVMEYSQNPTPVMEKSSDDLMKETSEKMSSFSNSILSGIFLYEVLVTILVISGIALFALIIRK